MRPVEYVERLRRVRDYLLSKPRTAREIAAHVDCTKMTAYSLVDALKDRGALFEVTSRRTGKRGPSANAYRLRKPVSIKN